MPMMKKKSKKSASKISSHACYEEVPDPPLFEDAPRPEPYEEAARGPYDEDIPAACDEEPPPEPFEPEFDIDASQRRLNPVQERSTQPSNPDIMEDKQEIKQEPTLALTETSQEVLDQAWIS
jgi:hypothetical protein